MIDYKSIAENPEVLAFLSKGNDNLGTLGYTDHSAAHCALVADRAAEILRAFGYDSHDIELVRICGFLHDIGNAINRVHHAEYGALLANDILKEHDITPLDRATIVACIGNHDESTGGAVDAISAALIIADKTDVRRNRVRTQSPANFDKHDRVNYAVTSARLKIDAAKKQLALNLQLDENICTMYEYFDIFLARMLMCRGAAEVLGAKFILTTNGRKVL